jgi:hypothetical protein
VLRNALPIAAALVGCAVGSLIGELFSSTWRALVLPDAWPASRPWRKGPGAPYYFAIWGFTHWLLIGGSAVFFYADRRAARKTEAHLHAAELDRIRRSKLALESRLQAMQARVEPSSCSIRWRRSSIFTNPIPEWLSALSRA